MAVVNLMIAGAQKCGTTALWSFLRQHEDVYFHPAKEVDFFDTDMYPDSVINYGKQFAGTEGYKWVGEANPSYIFLPYVPKRLKEYNKDMRIIVLLRDPVERAFSHWKMEVSRHKEVLGFAEAIVLEETRLEKGGIDVAKTCSYMTRGFYGRQLEVLYKHFPEEQVLVLPTEALRDEHEKVLFSCYKFLDVEPPKEFPKKEMIRPVMGVPKDIKIVPSFAENLRNVFVDDQKKLKELIGWCHYDLDKE